jgi:MPBQ/MSBQ methyltransferase
VARALAEAWMLFPPAGDYTRWMEAAGFTDVRTRALAPDWYRDSRVPYALAVSGVKPAPGPSPLGAAPPVVEAPVGRLRFAARFVLGSAAGALFVPIAAALTLRARRAERRRR